MCSRYRPGSYPGYEYRAPLSAAGKAEWQSHTVRQLNGRDQQVRLPARFQIVTKSWNRVVACPYMVNMPEKDRLLMLVGCSH